MNDDVIYSRFIESVLTTVQRRDGSLLNDLLNVTRMSQIKGLIFDGDDIDTNSDHENNLWRQLSQHHWSVCDYLHQNDIERAFRHQSKKFVCLMSIFNAYQIRLSNDSNEFGMTSDASTNDDDPSWLLPVFNRLTHELRLLALLGNDEGENDDNDPMDASNVTTSTIQTSNTQLLQAINVIQRFPATIKLRKVGIFIVFNHLLKTYYSLHKFNLCTHSISKAERPLTHYMREEKDREEIRYSSYVVTYRYFLGKHLLLKHDYLAAVDHFDYVFINCLHSDRSESMKNKQQSLLYLVVLKMLFGATPKMEILEKYQLHQLIDLIEPVRTGSLKLFLEKIREHKQFLFDTGLFFFIENLKFVTIRNLFRLTIAPSDQQQMDRIALESTLLTILNFGFDSDQLFTTNDLIDILNSMIEKKMIRGYISYKYRTLVLSRKDPFPRQYQFTSLMNTS